MRLHAATAALLLGGVQPIGAQVPPGEAPAQAASPQLATAAPPQAQAPPELLCNLRTGDETRTLRAPLSADPLSAVTATVAERFALRATLLGGPGPDESATSAGSAEPPGPPMAHGVQREPIAHSVQKEPFAHSVRGAPLAPALAVVSVLDLESADQPQTLAQGRWLLQGQAALPAGAPWAPLLTGWQRSYSPHLGRELAWGCALVAAGATPPGWLQADATLPLGEGDLAAPSARPGRPQMTPMPPTAARAPRPAGRAAQGPSVRLAWMGDVMLADGPGRVIARGGDPFAGVARLLRQADLRIANLECVIASSGRALDKPWTFRAHPRTLAVLKRHVDAVSVANNHSGDYGPQAFAEMLGRLERANLPHFGGGIDLRAAHRPLILQRNGLRIALLAYDEMFPRDFEAGEHTPGIAWADDEKIAAAIRAARAQADVVIPFMHWGQEHSPAAHARQRALARLMIRAGADAVVGTHPHVRQDTELIDGRPVIYSLGNFVFDGFTDADNNTGSILWMTVDAQGVVDWRLQAVGIDKQGRPTPR